MHLSFRLAPLAWAWLLGALSAAALPPIQPPTPTPPEIIGIEHALPSVSPLPYNPPIQTPTPIPDPGTVIAPGSIWIQPPPSPSVNPDELIPVVISYGEGQETRASIHRGLMEPVGVPAEQSVTVTLVLSSAYAGQIVKLGLYDGGQVGAVALPGSDMITFTNPGVPLPTVSTAGSVQFNFKAGAIFGLYRVLVTVGPAQFLLQFYAVRPRFVPDPVPVPSATVSPPPIS